MKKGLKIGIIVFGIIVILLGVSFLRNLYSNNPPRHQIPEITEFATEDNPVQIYKPSGKSYEIVNTIQVEKGKKQEIPVAFYNKENQTINVKIITGTSQIGGITGNKSHCIGSNWNETKIEIISLDLEIEAKEAIGFRTIIELDEEMEKQTYVCELAAQNVDTQEILATKQFFLKVI